MQDKVMTICLILCETLVRFDFVKISNEIIINSNQIQIKIICF